MNGRKVRALGAGLLSLSLAAGGYAVSGPRSSAPAPVDGATEAVAETEADALHGGPKPRSHGGDGVECSFPGTVVPTGNWTHGDYVSAWATWLATATEAEAGAAAVASVKQAAQSDCGKPVKGP